MAKKDKVGAVLVVGGGIGGIQASLDLAESGFFVYLIESSPAIGGVMAQLDKTFPTLDCSMCILSPKMVEAGRHLNIELLTWAEVLGIKGEPGDFTASIKKKARFVDEAKCTGCGLCVESCPISMPSEFDEGLGQRKAIYIPFLQAVPNTYVIDKREERPCKSACKDVCPVHMNVQGYIALIAQGRFREAYELIRMTNPLPSVCGRVCYAPCEQACNRGQIDEPISIRQLKRFAADQVDIDSFEVSQITKNGKKVAIIGSGPAGLACAHDLALEGYGVTIFEVLPEPGGMLRVGIPSYRLPKDVLDKEIGYIKKLGVEIKTNTSIGEGIGFEELRKSYEAIFIATGAHESLKLGVPGEDVSGVIHGVGFLRDINMGRKVQIGEKVAVIGGGNVAVDVSRVAKRLGAEVKIIYRRSRLEMPATPEEVEAAQAEGIELLFLAAPTRIIAEDKRVSNLECIRMELGEPDASGRRRPIPIEGSEFTVQVDMVIPALGQASDVEFVKELDLNLGPRGTIVIDGATLATNIEGIFAGGDVVTGPGMVIDAIAAGKKAARSIDEYLKDEPLTPKEDRKVPEELSEEEIADIKALFPSQKRVEAKKFKPKERTESFREVEQVYTVLEAQEEAGRCLASQMEGCFECHECEERCEAEAISYGMKDERIDLKVGAVILAPGFDEFDAKIKSEYGYGIYPNVVTSIELERLLCASGPFQGHLQRPSDGKEPKSIAFVQCVGSRDMKGANDYCSSVCCTYAIKEAIITKEHSEEVKPTIFSMDIRTYGKGFDEFYERAKDEYGVRFVRTRASCIEEVPHTRDLRIKYESEEGKLCEEEFDLVVLSVGLLPPKGAKELAKSMGIELDEYGFCKTSEFSPIATSKPGIFVCGAFQGPKDIPETVMQASGAVACVSGLLAPSRGTMVEKKKYPPEIDVSQQEPRIGAFICHCGINIGGYVDVPQVVEYAKTLPGVVYAEDNLYTCSQDTQERIKAMIKEHNLNRVMVASCTPRTHEPLFQKTIKEAGLNKYLFEMANIRDQCSWVHMREPELATQKAKALVRMAVAKAQLIEPLSQQLLDVCQRSLVIGGGLSGMTAALALANSGFEVYLVEKEEELGGNLRRIYYTLEGKDTQELLKETIQKVESNELIKVFTGSAIKEIDGFVGNFKTKLVHSSSLDPEGSRDPEGQFTVHSKETVNSERSTVSEVELEHGVIVVATGGKEYEPKEYLYGQDKRIITQLELEERLTDYRLPITDYQNVVMIQCVGSRDEERPYCSRYCCSEAIKNARKLKEKNANINVFILYRDIRTYGFKERYYNQAREEGVVFIRYEDDDKPQVTNSNGRLIVTAKDHILNERLQIDANLLVLSTGTVAPDGNKELSQMLKVPLNNDDFFLEAHVKLRPVDFATDGVFVCGLAHSPKFIEESISQANAAAGRAATVLTKDKIETEGIVASIDKDACKGCQGCIDVCSYNAITFLEDEGICEVNEVLCKGCGACSATCLSGSVKLKGFNDYQLYAQIEHAFA